MGVESYKHQFAKTTLANWLREVSDFDVWTSIGDIRWRTNRPGPNFGIWTEYPVCLDAKNEIVGLCPVWDEENWDGSEEHDTDHEDPCDFRLYTKPDSLLNVRPPTYDEVIAMGLTPIAIFDVAIQHKGGITDVFEVVHRSPISATKAEYLNRICSKHYIRIYTIDADWILSRVKRPDKLEYQKVI